MMERNNGKLVPPQQDELSLKELILKIQGLLRYLLSKWKIIILAGIIGGISGFVYALNYKPIYTATCTFVLEEGESRANLGQYAGLAAIAGINSGISGGGLFQGDNILELYKSRTMLEKTLLTYGVFNGEKDLLINRYIEINNLKRSWEKHGKLKNISFNIPKSKFTRLHDSVITASIVDINKKYLSVAKADKKTSIIEVAVKAKDEQFAKNFVDAVVFTVNNFYVQTKTKKAIDNLGILQRQADSVRSVLNTSLGSTAAAMDANPNINPALQILKVPSQRKQIDVQANSTIYAEIVKNLELAKMSARQDAPLIQIIDKPVYPLKKDSVGTLKGILSGGLLFTLLMMGLILAKFVFIRIITTI